MRKLGSNVQPNNTNTQLEIQLEQRLRWPPLWNCMVELHRIEQTLEQNVSEHHMHILSQLNKGAERSMGEQRTSFIMEAV